MISRRHLRIKVLQNLYAYFLSENTSIANGEKELNFSIDKLYDLYLHQLALPEELVFVANRIIEENKAKRLPTQSDLIPNKKFVDNQLIKKLVSSQTLREKLNKSKISWDSEFDLIKNLFNSLRETEEYKNYMLTEVSSFKEDKEFVVELFKKYLEENENLSSYYEEKSIYWLDDFELVNSMVLRTIKQIEEDDSNVQLMDVFNDAEDDKKFMIDLFKKTVINNTEYENLVQKYTTNWDVERIALMDILIMKMAICEVLNFNSIPLKVTLNEYIDISKRYSTPKSRIFVNGILDKIFIDLKRDGKIVKIGRGLME